MECPIDIVKSIWSDVLFKVCVSLLIWGLDGIAIGLSGELKSPTIILLILISLLWLLAFALYIEVLLCCMHTYLKLLYLLLELIP